jgi:hypothetical protein
MDFHSLRGFNRWTKGECQTRRVESLLKGKLVLARAQSRKSEANSLFTADLLAKPKWIM